MPTQIADVIVPAEFTEYIVENSLVPTALFQSGVAVPNGIMSAQLQAGAKFFAVPFWEDLTDTEANLSIDEPANHCTALFIGEVNNWLQAPSNIVRPMHIPLKANDGVNHEKSHATRNLPHLLP